MCVLIFLSLDCNLVIWYELNTKAVLEPGVSPIANLGNLWEFKCYSISKWLFSLKFQFLSDHTPKTCFAFREFCLDLPFYFRNLQQFSPIIIWYSYTIFCNSWKKKKKNQNQSWAKPDAGRQIKASATCKSHTVISFMWDKNT